MTPQEKAESLIDKIMSSTEHAKLSDYSRIYSPTAKKIALLTVNEMINSIKLIDPNNDSGLIGFWNNVKLYIETL
jgi:hypothetical protein